MTAPNESISKIAEALVELEPAKMKARIREYLRGGLPGASMSDGSKSAEVPLPALDGLDRRLEKAARDYRLSLQKAAGLVEHARQVQAFVLRVADPLPEPPVVPCANLACDGVLEPGRKSGCCSRCRVHEHRYGMPWPQKPDSTS